MSDISRITELREERGQRIEQMRSILDKADAEKRDLTAEEASEYDTRASEVDALDADIQRRERFASIKPNPELTAEADSTGDREERTGTATPAYAKAFNGYMRTGLNGDGYERRDLSVGTNAAGGFTVPTKMHDEIVQVARDYGVMREICHVITTGDGDTIQVPKVTAYGASGWIGEAAAFTESDPTFAQVSLSAFKASHIAQVSEELLQDSAFDIEGLIVNIMGRNLGVLSNTGYVVGTGTGQPTGITTQTTAGKTGLVGQTTSVITDDLIDLYHSVLPYYRRNGSWVMNDSSVKVVRKLKDSTNQYLWQPGLVAGQPDMLLGKPVYADPDVPVMAANAKSILFGDFSFYWIRDAGNVFMQRLNELYAGTGQVGFRAFLRTDGKLVDTTAVKHYANSAT